MTAPQDDPIGALRQLLSRSLAGDRNEHYGELDRAWIAYAEEYCWEEAAQDGRLALLADRLGEAMRGPVLDLAAGCGQFVFRALEAGYDCYGLEPLPWKLDFIRKKIAVLGRPPAWAQRFVAGVGERIPFPDDSFRFVTSYQTLEHVQDPQAVIAEMVRVTRPGGAIHLQCPDYRSTFEPHYRLPWLPLAPRPIAVRYLQLLRRPTAGLDALRYVTGPRIRDWVWRAAGNSDITVVDEDRSAYAAAWARRGLPVLSWTYPLFSCMRYVWRFGRKEVSVNLFIRINGK